MSSKQQTTGRTEINKANSQHSTGPKTEAGKQKSSRNALRHGLTSQMIVMPAEDLEAYRRHVESFTEEYHPSGATEAHLVQALADSSWRLNRIVALESNVLSLDASLEAQSKALASLSMHSQRLSRQFERTVTQLRELQKIRLAVEKAALADFLEVMDMYEAGEEEYDPSQDGFVFSDEQIHAAIRARNRERVVDEALDFHESAAA